MIALLKSACAASVATLVATSACCAMDGVFTEIQAARGQTAYLKECSSCHARDMSGSERSPGLAGDTFLRRWQGQFLEKLFTRIRRTMPQNNPASLSDNDYVDILAFIMQSNGFPEGEQELIPDVTVLGKITIAAVL